MKRLIKSIGWILVLVFMNTPAYSQDSLKQRKLLVTGYVKDLGTFIYQDINNSWTTENLIHNRLNFKWLMSPKMTAALEMRNRFAFGNIFENFPGYDKTFESDNGIINFSKNLIDEKNYLLNTTIDRLWLQYAEDKFQVTIGRQRINWGQTFVWNPNDIFNTYSYFDFDYEEKPGSDAVRVQYNSTPTSVIEFAAKENNQKKATIAGLYRFNKWNWDIQFLGGISEEEDIVAGAGWSGQILKGGFRGEVSYFHRMKEYTDTTGIFLASVSYDYTFKNSLFLQLEALYNGNQQSSNILSLSQLNSNNISAKNLFSPGFSLFGSLTYPFTPLISSSLASIENFKYKLFFISPSVTISLKENLELTLLSQIMHYSASDSAGQDLAFFFARVKFSF